MDAFPFFDFPGEVTLADMGKKKQTACQGSPSW
jgi:hypothetical protein